MRKELSIQLCKFGPDAGCPHLRGRKRPCRLRIAIVNVCEEGVVICNDFPIDAIAWLEGGQVKISTLKPKLSMPLKSSCSDQSPRQMPCVSYT